MKTMILLHGWGATGAAWQKQVQAFQNRLQVQAPDIPVWDPAWLGAYLQNFSLPDCLLVGWSLGGMLLLEVLAQQTASLGGLVLAGVPAVFCSRPDHPWGRPPAAVRAMRLGIKSDPRKVLRDFAQSCLGPEEVAFQEEVVSLFQGGDGSNLAAGLDYLRRQDLRPSLAKLTAAVTIIQGDQDPIVPPEQARFFHEHLPGSSLRLLPGAGHLPFLTQAEVFNQILEEVVGEGLEITERRAVSNEQ
jgi:pimeloyl-[acyl-carrier protein] methyl ester esterase